MRRHTDRTPLQRWTRNLLLIVISAIITALLLSIPFAFEAKAAEPTARVRVPEHAVTYRLRIEREAARNFGLDGDAVVARMAAQIHQESGWRANAASPYAYGLTQFTPATARWLPTVCPEVGEPDVWDASWAIRAQSCYMAWLHRRVGRIGVQPIDDCTRWNFALRGYNGGEGWLTRERRLALNAGANPNAWREVEGFRSRAGWAHKENTHYPRVILLRLEPAYIAAGWPGDQVCP
ncbi:MAG: transglycosylase SLT domain-containing protein [Xanthomonadaceae bacterium]|nr:transglycosylase SLT domain-containing protein [Xanthomonadaceae bacterium]